MQNKQRVFSPKITNILLFKKNISPFIVQVAIIRREKCHVRLALTIYIY